MKDFFYDELNKEVGIVGNLDETDLDSSEYIYGTLNKLVEQKEYKGSSTDTVQVLVDNKTNTISANLLATNIATTQYVDNAVDKATQDIDLEIHNLSNDLNQKIQDTETSLQEQIQETSNNLQSNINGLDNRVTSLENEDKQFDVKINALSDRITTNANNINQEISDRTNADDTLQANIDKVDTDINKRIDDLKTSNLQNDGDGTSPFTTQTYVGQQIPIKSISINSDNLIPDGFKNVALPIGSSNNYGVFKSGNGINSTEGILTTNKATNEDIENQTDNYKPIVSSNYKYAVENIVGNQEDIQSGETNLVNAVNKLDTDLANEITIRTNNDTNLQKQVDWLKENSGKIDSISLNETPLAIDENKNVEITVNKATVGLENVDNTSDINKPVSNAQLAALNLKLDKSNTNLNMTKDVSVTTSGDNVYLNVNYKNLTSGDESSNQKQLMLASDTQAGLMSMSDYAQIRENTDRIEQLEGQNIRLLYSDKENPDEVDIRNFVISSGYKEVTQWDTIGVVVKGTNHIWRYYNNTMAWEDIGVDTVQNFTNEVAGIILGAEIDGKVYAETDGTGSVYGWGNLLGRVSTNESNISENTTSIASLQNTKLNNSNWNPGQNLITDGDGNITTEQKPTIPTVNNSSITINKNGTSVGTFTLNQDSNGTIDINNVQDTLVSGTNIKTINDQSLLGSGNISIQLTPTDVRINNTSITSNNIANIVTKTLYNASTNKIVTENDLPPTITINNSVAGSETISDGTNTVQIATRNTKQTLSNKTLSALRLNVGTCDTAANTAAKVVTLDSPTYILQSGDIIDIKFTNTNGASNPTLNVNSSGAKAIKYISPVKDGTTTENTGAYAWNAGEVVEFLYDGTYFWQLTSNNLKTSLTAIDSYKLGGKLAERYVNIDDDQTVMGVKNFDGGMRIGNSAISYLTISSGSNLTVANNATLNFASQAILNGDSSVANTLTLKPSSSTATTVTLRFRRNASSGNLGYLIYDTTTDTFTI